MLWPGKEPHLPTHMPLHIPVSQTIWPCSPALLKDWQVTLARYPLQDQIWLQNSLLLKIALEGIRRICPMSVLLVVLLLVISMLSMLANIIRGLALPMYRPA